MRRLCVIPFLATFAAGAVAHEVPPASTLRVTGEAVLEVPPDEVRIDLGVTTQAAMGQGPHEPGREAAMGQGPHEPSREATAAREAAAENARLADAVVRAVRGVLGETADVRTVGYRVEPVERYRQDRPPEIVAYRVSNIIRVKTGDLGRTGDVIDAAMRAGANRVEGLVFGLADETAARREALRQAAARARTKAEAAAAGAGVRLGRVRSVEEHEGYSPRPLPIRAAMAEAADVSTPVEAGRIEVRAIVTVTFELE